MDSYQRRHRPVTQSKTFIQSKKFYIKNDFKINENDLKLKIFSLGANLNAVNSGNHRNNIKKSTKSHYVLILIFISFILYKTFKKVKDNYRVSNNKFKY